MQKLNYISQQYDLKIKTTKTKFMIIDRARNIEIEVTMKVIWSRRKVQPGINNNK